MGSRGLREGVGGRDHCGPRLRANDKGMVTAEIAVGLIGVMAVLAMLIHCIGIGIGAVKVQEASRVAARAAARGDSKAEIVQAAKRVNPGSKVSIDAGAKTVTVEVSARAGPIPGLPTIQVRGKAVADVEDP